MTKKLEGVAERKPRGTDPDPAGPKIGCRVEKGEEEALLSMLPSVPTQDGKKASKSAVVRAIVLPVLERARRILDMPMPAGTTLRQRIEAVLDKGLA